MVEAKVDLRRIEECGLNAWPALQVALLDGWLLRVANGYTKRANSANPLYDSCDDPDSKIGYCERFYRGRQLPPIFRLTPFALPTDLDDRLAARGYALVSPTSLWWAALTGELGDGDDAVRAHGNQDWLVAYARISGTDVAAESTHGAILAHTLPAQQLMVLWEGAEPVACGRAVVEDRYVGLFSVVTAERHRRQGYGRRLVEALLAWGQAQGADTAYLAVVSDNDPARRLYQGCGFQPGYEYWYRVAAR